LDSFELGAFVFVQRPISRQSVRAHLGGHDVDHSVRTMNLSQPALGRLRNRTMEVAAGPRNWSFGDVRAVLSHRHILLHTPARPSATFSALRAARRGLPDALALTLFESLAAL
jgi:hypothetical protein